MITDKQIRELAVRLTDDDPSVTPHAGDIYQALIEEKEDIIAHWLHEIKEVK